MNPDFVRYLEEQKTTRINLNGIESNLLGYVPPPVDLSYLSGQQITRIHETSPLENNRTILLATLVDQQYSVIAATGSAPPPGSTSGMKVESQRQRIRGSVAVLGILDSCIPGIKSSPFGHD